MLEDTRKQQWLKFVIGIILPTLLAILISIASIYLVVIPAFERSFLESKKEMIRELANVAWSVLVLYEQKERAGTMTRPEAQQKAMEEIEHLRYGTEGRDYFWISDMQPKLLMHPYSKELIGSDLSEYTDAGGKRVFMEIKAAVSDKPSGFIDYIWNKKYMTERDVPKLSYVRKFDPWGWVVGTGVFLDDVERRTAEITRRMTRMIYAAVALFTMLLLYVTHHSMVIERKRRSAEESLNLSRKKYKTLVESAVDPIMMVHNGTCLYANKSMEQLVGYSIAELENMVLTDLFPVDHDKEKSGLRSFTDALHGYVIEDARDAILVKKDGSTVAISMTMSRKDLGTQKVIVFTARDITGKKQIEEQLDESREKYRQLTNRLDIGVFRCRADGRFRLLEINPVLMKLLNVEDEKSLEDLNLLEIVEQEPGAESLPEALKRDGFVKERLCRLRQDNGIRDISVSMVLSRNGKGEMLYCDGIIEDISRHQKTAQEREDLIVELQTSMMFLNQPVKNALTDILSCDLNTPVSAAARQMTEKGKTSILVSSESGIMIGIVTDVVLRERVLLENLPPTTPVYEVMSSPLIHIDETALIFEAVLLIQERGIKHLAVRDGSGAVVSVISNEELLDVQRYSSAFLIEKIRKAETVEEITRSHERLPRIVKALTDSGAHAKNITRIITTVSDTVLGRLIDFAIEELGEPPVRFAFMSLGSEGRGEQTLVTDQDNALIYEDVVGEQAERAADYFGGFSKMVCTWLDQVGYDFCKGNVMAMNPEWCQPISRWKENFRHWVSESSPEDLVEVSIFFDFRCLYGDSRFTDELREYIASHTENKAPFLYNLAQNTLLFKVPIDFFGKLAVESGGEHPNTFNIKHAMAQVVGFARIYAINYALECTNTLQRIDALLDKKVLNRAGHEEIVEAYNYLMQLRFRHQVLMLDKGEPPDNHVHIDELTHVEKEVLEKIFGQVNRLRKRLSLVTNSEIFF